MYCPVASIRSSRAFILLSSSKNSRTNDKPDLWKISFSLLLIMLCILSNSSRNLMMIARQAVKEADRKAQDYRKYMQKT